MPIRKQTGIVLSFEASNKVDIIHTLRSLSFSIDAVHIKLPVLLRESVQIIRELKSFMNEVSSYKPIIIDYRLEPSELDSLKAISRMFKEEGAYGMTIMALYGETFIKLCKKETEIGIFAIVDVGIPSFKNRFNDSLVIENAVFARDNGCEGVIVTSKHLERIKKVRDTIGKGFHILSTLEEGAKQGDAILAGADFEIIPQNFFRSTNF